MLGKAAGLRLAVPQSLCLLLIPLSSRKVAFGSQSCEQFLAALGISSCLIGLPLRLLCPLGGLFLCLPGRFLGLLSSLLGPLLGSMAFCT